MGTTANRLYPYPDPTDPADMPGALQALAEAVDVDVEALTDSLSNVPLCVVTADTPQQIAPGPAITMRYTTVNFDNANMANLATASTLIVPPAGTYFLHFSARCPDVTTVLEAFLRVGSGLADFGRVIHQGNAQSQPRLAVSALATLAGNDPVRGTITQNTGAVQTISTARLVAYRVA